MAGLAWHNFLSAAVGICIALALAHGLTYRLQAVSHRRSENFWVDLIRSIVYFFLPICPLYSSGVDRRQGIRCDIIRRF